jgi:hypothetical protein
MRLARLAVLELNNARLPAADRSNFQAPCPSGSSWMDGCFCR